jgi:excisionase family DNA binding protein
MDEHTLQIDQLPPILTPPQAAELLQIGRTRIYELCRTAGFPSTRVGKSFRISKARLLEWVDNGGLDQQVVTLPPPRRRHSGAH